MKRKQILIRLCGWNYEANTKSRAQQVVILTQRSSGSGSHAASQTCCKWTFLQMTML